jgi:hypothetical protein
MVFRFFAIFAFVAMAPVSADVASIHPSRTVGAGTGREAIINVRYKFVGSVDTGTDTRAGFKRTFERVHRVLVKRAA